MDGALLGAYLSGINTRRLRGALSPLLRGAPLSKDAISRLVGRLRDEFNAWLVRDLAAEEVCPSLVAVDSIVVRRITGGHLSGHNKRVWISWGRSYVIALRRFFSSPSYCDARTRGKHSKNCGPGVSYNSSLPGEPHREGGGDEGAVVFYSVRGKDGVLFEVLDDDLNVVGTLSMDDFLGALKAQKRVEA